MHIAFGMCFVGAVRQAGRNGRSLCARRRRRVANIVRFAQHNNHFYRLRSSSLGCPAYTHFMVNKVVQKIFAFFCVFNLKWTSFSLSLFHCVCVYRMLLHERTHFCNILGACMQLLMANSTIMSIFPICFHIYCVSYKLIIISISTAICFQCINNLVRLCFSFVSFLQQRTYTENKLCHLCFLLYCEAIIEFSIGVLNEINFHLCAIYRFASYSRCILRGHTYLKKICSLI